MPRLLMLLSLFVLTHTLASESRVTVYQLSGAAHCHERAGLPPEEAADLLRAQGVSVVAAERRTVPLETGGQCGAPTGEANVLTVAAADWTAFTNQHPDAAGYGLWVFDAEAVEVYQYDGTLQCGLGQEIPLAAMVAELQAAGIQVQGSRKGSDGLHHIAVCGASTGAINVLSIPRESLGTARQLGYRLLVTREITEQIKPSRGALPEAAGPGGPKASSAAPTPLLW